MVAMKNALFTATLREVRHTFTRFMSIFLIVALGTGFFAGIKATTPDMLSTIDTYFDENHLADIRLVSTMGFDENDIAAIRNTEGVNGVMPSYTADVLTNEDGKQLVLRMHSINVDADQDENLLNRPVLLEGRMPQKTGECLAEASGTMTVGFKIGDVISVQSGTDDPLEDFLATDEFTVVGLVMSPYYISFERGNSSIGSGAVDRYLYVREQDFCYEVHTDVFVTLSGALEQQSYSDKYNEIVDTLTDRFEAVAEVREQERYDEIITEATAELDKAKRELADAREEAYQKLNDARAELDDARKKLDDGYKEYKDGLKTFQTEIADAQKQLDDGYKELAEGWQQYRAGLSEYEKQSSSAYEQLADAERQIAAGQARYEQGLAAYEQGVQTHTALTQAFALLQNPEATPEQRQMALMTISGIASVLAEQEDTAELAGVLSAYAAAPENPINIYMMQAALDGFAQTLDASKQELDKAKAELDAAKSKVSAGYKALSEASEKLASARLELEEAEKTLAEKRAEFEDAKAKGEKELADAAAKLAKGERDLADGEAEYQKAKEDAERELADAQTKIDDAQTEIDDLSPPEWYILTRDSIPGNSGYYEDSMRIDAISKVFPVFFFLVAALVCLTTMTRMVEEQRTELGVIKALGYGKGAAVFKFMFYSGTASLLGSFAGLAVGFRVFPFVIGAAYGIMYQIPAIQTSFHWEYAIPTMLVAVLSTMLAALLACYKELAEQPATLMRPKAPKPGKRVLLERVTPVWRRLGFIQKVTVRNLMRYKRRMLMTVIGIAGCTALMLAGFGMKNSIASIASKQYGEVFLYNGMVILNQDADAEDKEALDDTLKHEKNITGTLDARQEQVTALVTGNKKEIDAVQFVPENNDTIGDYAVLRTRIGQEPISLDIDGAVITEKLAKLLHLEVGDTITLRDSDNRLYDVKVGAITENYVYHYIYLSRAEYERVFGTDFVTNTLFMRLADTSDDAQDALSQTLISNKYVVSITYNSSVEKSFHDVLKSLDYVVLVLIISAGLLAFVVLYNLTNINVTERIREIATIKVLGFYDREVSSYIYRENILLTLMGIAFGLFGGIFLHRFVVSQAEIDVVMFGREVGWFGYMMSALLTAVFSLLVNLVLHFRLKHISMVESLKSVE